MKKIYMPSMDELYQMQDMGANVYKYLVAKLIESIAMMRTNSGKGDVLLEVYKYLREDPNIVFPICLMYPDEVRNSEIAKSDVKLCLELLGKEPRTACNLDILANFDSSVQTNNLVLRNVIIKLEEELRNNPRYRFEYRNNILIDRILNRELTEANIISCRDEEILSLLKIEPTYWNIIDPTLLGASTFSRAHVLRASVNCYADRYNIPSNAGDQYFGKDILTNPETEVKRLMRCIKKYK